jgi:hypothetical protein
MDFSSSLVFVCHSYIASQRKNAKILPKHQFSPALEPLLMTHGETCRIVITLPKNVTLVIMCSLYIQLSLWIAAFVGQNTVSKCCEFCGRTEHHFVGYWAACPDCSVFDFVVQGCSQSTAVAA